MCPLGLQAIYPKTKILDPEAMQAQVQAALRAYGLAVAAKMAQYPAQTTTAGRQAYRRTGDLGRYWNAPGALTVTSNSVTLVNRVNHNGRSYAVYVQGPTKGGVGQSQTSRMRDKGWQSISTVAHDTAQQYQPILNRAIKGRATA